VTQPVQVGDVIQFRSGVTHRIENDEQLRFAKWLIEHEKAVVSETCETSESEGGHR
jgi:quercetin dioxygenase-like cupin family protein